MKTDKWIEACSNKLKEALHISDGLSKYIAEACLTECGAEADPIDAALKEISIWEKGDKP